MGDAPQHNHVHMQGEPKVSSFLREGAIEEGFLHKGKGTTTRAVLRSLQLLTGVGVAATAFTALDGFKDAFIPNSIIDNALNNVPATSDVTFDLHDVMFQNATVGKEGIDYTTLDANIWLYVMAGTLILSVALFLITNSLGLNVWGAAIICVITMGAG